MSIDTGQQTLVLPVDDMDILTHVLRRYDAQVCYCGEPSCLGTIGGKTQTDIRILDPLYIEGETVFHDVCAVMILISPLSFGLVQPRKRRLERSEKKKVADHCGY